MADADDLLSDPDIVTPEPDSVIRLRTLLKIGRVMSEERGLDLKEIASFTALMVATWEVASEEVQLAWQDEEEEETPVPHQLSWVTRVGGQSIA